jgi:hypothetical protein
MLTRRPDLAAEWDEESNGGVKAAVVSATSARQYAWKTLTADPRSFSPPMYVVAEDHGAVAIIEIRVKKRAPIPWSMTMSKPNLSLADAEDPMTIRDTP